MEQCIGPLNEDKKTVHLYSENIEEKSIAQT